MLLKSDLKNYYIRDSRYWVWQEHSLIVLLLHLSILYPMFKSGFGETPFEEKNSLMLVHFFMNQTSINKHRKLR